MGGKGSKASNSKGEHDSAARKAHRQVPEEIGGASASVQGQSVQDDQQPKEILSEKKRDRPKQYKG